MREELGLAHLAGGLLEHVNECVTDDFPFRFRIGHAPEFAHEQGRGILVMKLNLEVTTEHLLDDPRLVGAEHAVVYEDAGQLLADGLVDQRRRDARVDAAAQAEDHLFPAGLGADVLHRLLDVVAHRPFAAAAANFVNEVGEDFFALRRMDDFRVKLKAVKARPRIFDRREGGVLRGGDRLEAVRQAGELVAVRVPDLQFARQSVKQPAPGAPDAQRALAVLPFLAPLHLALEEPGHHLQPEADAEHWHTQVENRPVRQRGIFGIHAGRSAGEDDAARIHLRDLGGGRVVVDDGGVDLALSNASRNDLRVLGTKIQYDNLLVHRVEKEGLKPLNRPLCETKNCPSEIAWPSGGKIACRLGGYTNSGIGLPWRTIITGRPVGV